MAIIELASANGVVLSVDLDAGDNIATVILDATNATGRARLLYPEDGSRIDIIVGPGTPRTGVYTRSFNQGQRLRRTLVMRTRPSDGAQIPSWAAPTYRLETAE